jgi:hypothetical protein
MLILFFIAQIYAAQSINCRIFYDILRLRLAKIPINLPIFVVAFVAQ